jgi:BlaR1 peptidase M56
MGLGVGLSLIRVACGLWAIAKLFQRSRVVVDDRLAAVAEELAPAMCLRRLPQVRESSSLVSAAVFGWWRPVVVLPSAWRGWSTIELKAVLAHELAHVCRRDSLVRLITALTMALQWAQPLVYWLRRQLLLAQEMAADELAAAAVGSRAEYLQAITRLALRQDSRPLDGSVGLLLPVFSGFLLRRIDMLRAKDGSARRGLRQTLQWSAIAIVALTAAGTTALRGLAQPPEGEADGSVRVATATAAKVKLAAMGSEAHAAAATLFQRPAFDPAAIAGKDGGFVVRLGEILKRGGFAEQAGKLDASFAAFWKDAFPEAPDVEAPAWSLQDIEYIAGDFFFGVKPRSSPTAKGSNWVMFGAPSIVVRWHKPLNGQFKWLLRIPGATEKSYAGTVYVELPIMPAIGPTRMCVCPIDDHTLFAAQNETLFLSRLSTVHGAGEPKTWQKTWKEVDGGLLAFVTTDANIVRPLGEPVNEEAKLYHDLFSHARVHAVGVDWQANADGVSVVKAQFRFDTAEDAERFKNAVRTSIEKTADLAKVEEAKGERDKSEKDKKAEPVVKGFLEALQKAKIETRQSDDGWLVDVQLAGPLDYRPLWGP